MKLDDAIEMVSEACYHYDGELYENCNYSEAFDTVLEELDNRIPRKDIEDKIEGLENIKLCGGAVNKAICEEKIQLLKNILKWRN